jgi:hypothetical protein
MNRGYVITWDALIALSFTVFVMLGFIGLQHSQPDRGVTSFERLHSVAENAIDTVEKRGVLEEVGYFWSQGNSSYAANLTRDSLDNLIPRSMGYRLEAVVGSNVSVIYDSRTSGEGRPMPQDAVDQTRTVRLISGYKENSSRVGWAARAWFIENYSWDATLASNVSDCCNGWDSLLVGYPTSGGAKPFYVTVPGRSLLLSAHLNISWASAATTTSTSTTTTSTTTSTTSTTIVTIDCSACPASSACEITAPNTANTYVTHGDAYFYHSFTVPSACMVKVTLYTGTAANPHGTNMYDLYGFFREDADGCNGACGNPTSNACECECSAPPFDPTLWYWNCEAQSMGYPYTGTSVSCDWSVSPGTYQVMVDCWSSEGFEWCDGGYKMYLSSATPACNIAPPP